MLVTRAAVFASTAVVLLLLPPSLAEADRGNGGAGGKVGGDTVTVVVTIPGAKTPGVPGSGATPWTGGGYVAPPMVCFDFAVSVNPGSPVPGPGAPITDFSTVKAGDLVWVECRDASSGVLLQATWTVWDPAIPPASQVPAPPAVELGQQALRQLQIPVPAVAFWPADIPALVRFPVLLHVENWGVLSATATAGGLSATVTATPVRSEFMMTDRGSLGDDSTTVTCRTAGTVYNPNYAMDDQGSDCSYTFRHSTGGEPDLKFHESATLVWQVSWSATNGQGGDLGEMARTSAFVVDVEEAHSVIVAN